MHCHAPCIRVPMPRDNVTEGNSQCWWIMVGNRTHEVAGHAIRDGN